MGKIIPLLVSNLAKRPLDAALDGFFLVVEAAGVAAEEDFDGVAATPRSASPTS
jgi:hypothetical protein